MPSYGTAIEEISKLETLFADRLAADANISELAAIYTEIKIIREQLGVDGSTELSGLGETAQSIIEQ